VRTFLSVAISRKKGNKKYLKVTDSFLILYYLCHMYVRPSAYFCVACNTLLILWNCIFLNLFAIKLEKTFFLSFIVQRRYLHHRLYFTNKCPLYFACLALCQGRSLFNTFARILPIYDRESANEDVSLSLVNRSRHYKKNFSKDPAGFLKLSNSPFPSVYL